MTSPLQGALAAQVYSGMKNLFLDATLTVDTPGTSSDPADPGPATQTTYSCKAIVEKYSDFLRAQGVVGASDRKVLILANSLAVTPAPENRVTISGITFTIVTVATDPATAVWEVQGRM
jgi:hypothetical protein